MNTNFDFFQGLFAPAQVQGLVGSISLQQQLQLPTTQHMRQHFMVQHLAQLEPMTRLSTQLHMLLVSKSTQATLQEPLVPQLQGTPVGDMITLMERQETWDIQVCRQFRVRRFWMHNDGKRMRQFLYYNIMFEFTGKFERRITRQVAQNYWFDYYDTAVKELI